MDKNIKTLNDIQPFLDQVTNWAKDRADIQALILVGSYSRSRAKPSSDIDFVLLIDEPRLYLSDQSWLMLFGSPLRQQIEYYGKVTSVRVWYQAGPEVEYGLTTPDWAARPIDQGTERCLMDGAKVLFERFQLLNPLLEGFSESEEIYANMIQDICRRANPDFAARNRLWFKNIDFKSYGLTAAAHKEIIKLHKSAIRKLPLHGRLHLARLLVLSEMAEEINFANTILSWSVKELYPADFPYLDVHLNHFHGWSHVDDLSLNVLQPLLDKYPIQTLDLLRAWNHSENQWKRRASVVVFVRKIGSSGRFTNQALELCENLVWDKEDLVQKGVGWALKDTMRGDHTRVLEYIKSLRKRRVPAKITLYAIRDLRGLERDQVLAISPPKQ